MDARSGLRTIIAALVGIGLIVLVIVLLVKAFTGNGAAPSRQVDIGKYANTSATATLLIDGITNLDQDHRQLKFTVSATQNEIDLIQGYEGNVITSHTYPNNSVAYGTFLQALKLLNFSKGVNSSVDYRGYCPAGDRYLYSFNDGQSDLFSYWSTSCGQGTFEGAAPQVRQLFERQVTSVDLNTLSGEADVIL